MEDKGPQTHITWGANENFAQDFSRHYELAQAYFRHYRRDPFALIDLWDCVHQLYVMEEPYLDKDEYQELFGKDADMATSVSNCRRSEIFMRSNRSRLYSEIDTFFRRLTRIAVEKKFFPMAAKTRSLDDKLDAAMHQR